MKSIGYHTRLYSDSTIKIAGGSFGGSMDGDTIERLVNNGYTVIVKPSGAPVFVDIKGREVMLYVTVDARECEKGKTAIEKHHLEKGAAREQRAAREAQQEKDERDKAVIESMTAGLSYAEIIFRLSVGPLTEK